ncbi:MAG: hypothetical protein JKY54_02705 [Flavobacteriales bacterium]|nr:hypothetical protein [Flavobacteriales bacterium]
MGTYINSLSTEQKANVEFMIHRMAEKGITNPFNQAGILAVVSKESSFIPKSEHNYSGTSNSRIRKIFGKRVSELSETELTKLKNDPKAFFDKIYGGRYHNAPDEGYKYRGRGLNQLTFKSNYEKVNPDTEADVVKNPDRLNEMPVATDALIGFFKRAFSKSNAKLSEYNMKDINDAKSTQDAVGAAYHANTGWGKSKAQIDSDNTGGHKKATERVDEFYQLTKNFAGSTANSSSSANGVSTSAVASNTQSSTSEPTEKFPIHYYKGKNVPYGKELQQFLNQFPGISIHPDGKPGKNTSAAFKKVMGYYLEGDPRIE